MIGLLPSWPVMLVVVGFFTMAVVALWVLIDAISISGMMREDTFALTIACGR
jgi:hypothetical protein